MIREKRTKSGPLLDVDFCHVFSNGSRIPDRKTKEKRSTAEQEKYNRNQKRKNAVRIVNTNFNGTDYLMHPTYEQAYAPQNEEDARKDIVNYLRRVKYSREKKLKKLSKELNQVKEALDKLPKSSYLKEQVAQLKEQIKKLKSPYKYYYCIEQVEYKSGKRAGMRNYHFHLFVTGGLDRGEMEELWNAGVRTNCDRFQPDKFGPEAAAKYITKDNVGRYAKSRNMDKPDELPPKDDSVTYYQLEKMCKQRVDDAAYWENRYKGYRFVCTYPRYNAYNGHWYLSVIMYKTGGDPPKWRYEDWITE